jgi:3-isopropylmalate dehydrogenase
MLLDWLGRCRGQENLGAAARLIAQSVDVVLGTPATRTADLGGPQSTTAFTSELCKKIDVRASR